MYTLQRELSFGMIKAVDVHPGFYSVAGFAAECRSIGTLSRHPISKLDPVGVLMTSGTRAVFEMERQDFVDATCRTYLVAIPQGTATCAPVSAKCVALCCAMVKVVRWKSITVWHGSQRCVGRGSELIVVCVFVATGAG